MSTLFPIILLFLIIIIIGSIILKIKHSLKSISKAVFHTDSIIEGLSNINLSAKNSPRSISSMTRIYLPQITIDFPDFHYFEMRERAESLLKSYFMAINKSDVTLLTEGSSELKNQLSMLLRHQISQKERIVLKDFKIYQTEITKYEKSSGKIVITFQSSVQYIYYVLNMLNQVIEGNKDEMKQTLYNTSVYYIQNPELISNIKEQGIGLTCPNCGAPIHTIGLKFCEYCGSKVIEINRFVWIFGEIVEDSKYI
jgi:hypothetical protein